MKSWGFHEGELAVQRLAGVQFEAGRLEAMLKPANLSGGAAKFLAVQTFAALTARDHTGELWISPLAARPGFLHGDGDVLTVSAIPREGDPLHGLPIDQQVGLIVIDFHARRRLRINGVLAGVELGRLVIRADQAYGNCPQYIHPHRPDAAVFADAPAATVNRSNALTPGAGALISAADTFFLGTTHPTRGSDASHRGGPSGFVRVDSDAQLSWPDFPGNNMFNSFGNLAVNNEAALLFIDFGTGATLHLSGTAAVRRVDPSAPGEVSERRVEFAVAAARTVAPLPTAGPA